MSMCLRCHFNVPFAPGEDFCLDCYGDVEFEIEQALKEREGLRSRELLTNGNPSVEPSRSLGTSDNDRR